MIGPRLSRSSAALLVIDVQERLFAAMDPVARERMLKRLVAAAVLTCAMAGAAFAGTLDDVKARGVLTGRGLASELECGARILPLLCGECGRAGLRITGAEVRCRHRFRQRRDHRGRRDRRLRHCRVVRGRARRRRGRDLGMKGRLAVGIVARTGHDEQDDPEPLHA